MGLILLSLVASLCIASYALWRRRGGGRALTAADRPALPAASGDEEPGLGALRPGDVVSHLGADYIVEGSFTIEEDGRPLRVHRLADGGTTRWLGVRDGAELPLLLDEVEGLPIDRGAPEELVHAGAPYRLERRVHARVRRAGALGPRIPGRTGDQAQIAEYAGVGDRRLLAVTWPDGTDVFEGAAVPATHFDIYPAG